MASSSASPTQALPSQPSVPPAEILAAALAPLQAAAEFETMVTLDDAVAVTSVGRSVGGASQLTVTTGGEAVEYIRVPPDAWARQAGGSWVLVAVEQAPGSPLDVLAAPSTLDVVPGEGTSVTLSATYPAAALGLVGDPVAVEITVAGASLTFTYQAESAGHRTVSATIIRPTTLLDPIVAPSAPA